MKLKREYHIHFWYIVAALLEETAAPIDGAVRRLIEAAFGTAVSILAANRALLIRAAAALLAKETMSSDDLQASPPSCSR